MAAYPNLLIIGAMKCGTTYLHELLAGHPEIFMSTPKEPCFFVDPRELARGWPQMARAGYSGDEDRYLALFAAAGDCRYRGESSTLYTLAPILSGVPGRIRAHCPDPRLIYLMRDPLTRTLSHWWHDTRVSRSLRPARTALDPGSEYLIASDYHGQLLPYVETFGRERVLALTFEALVARPGEVLDRIFRWLGVAPGHVPADLDIPRNVGSDSAMVGRLGGQRLYRLRHSKLGKALVDPLPWRARAAFAKGWEHPVRRSDLDTAAVRAHLRGIQQPQTERLADLLGRDFPEWTALHGSG
jgi:hypothetical protein